MRNSTGVAAWSSMPAACRFGENLLRSIFMDRKTIRGPSDTLWVALCSFMVMAWLNVCSAEAKAVSGEMLLFQEIPRVVTASRQTVSVLESPSTATIITRDDILHSGFNSTADLLRFVAGVDFFKAAASGPNIGMRGVNGVQANQVLVLVDGRPIFNPARNSNQCALIPEFPNDIERIEVVRGPGSALYGSHAFAGVVNIITRPPDDIDGIDLMASPGTFASGLYNFNAGMKRGNVSYKLLGGWTQQASPSDHHNQVKGLMKFAGELNYTWRPGAKMEFSFGLTSGNVAVMPMNAVETFDQDGEDGFLRARLKYDDTSLDVWWRHHHTSADIKFFVSTEKHYWDFDNVNITAYHHFRWGSHETVTGAELRTSSLGATSYDDWHNQFLYGFFMEDRWRLPHSFSMFFGARYDHHPLAGGSFSPRLSIVKQLNSMQSLRFSASQAFKYPSYLQSYVEQYSTIPNMNFQFIHRGNRDLDPEKLVSLEAAYQMWNTSGFQATIAAYYNNYYDIIDFHTSGNKSAMELTYENMYDMYQYGGEIDLSYRFNRNLLVKFNYSYVWKQKKDGITFGPVPTNQLNSEIRFNHETGIWMDLRIHWQDSSDYSTGIKAPSGLPDSGTLSFSPEEILKRLEGWHLIDGYTYGDLSAGYRPKDAPYSISCAAHNLFHSRVREYPGGPRPDTTFTGRITWHF